MTSLVYHSSGYGFLILHALVTDIEPAAKVKEVCV